MLSIQQSPITRAQFSMLVKAKHQIRKEFKTDVNLNDENLMENIFEFSMRSQNDELFSLFDQLCKAAPHA